MVNYDYLEATGYKMFIAGNKGIAIKTDIENIRGLYVEEQKDQPLWKQAMSLQMGRMPKPVTQMMYYKVREVPEDTKRRYLYRIYDIIF